MIKQILVILGVVLLLPLAAAEINKKELPVSYFMMTGKVVVFIFEDNTDQLFYGKEGGRLAAKDGKAIPGYEDLKLVKIEKEGFLVSGSGKEYFITKVSGRVRKTRVQQAMVKPFSVENEKLENIIEKLFKGVNLNYALLDNENIKIGFSIKTEEPLDMVLDKILIPIGFSWEYEVSKRWVVIKKKSELELANKIFFMPKNAKNKAQLAEELKENVKALLSKKGSVKVMPLGDSVYVQDTEENMKVIEEIIRKMIDK
ncbi:MAG: hypothetical protein A2231_08155 [Candidatus Firestonebacteria bacterium RIFOXYA2_FULL_40_8]|nr:MAG: hypothetical protein A2231_08155 [Candidatus Firestonebacteria bacterium RIFOXYA2_FULL_40_8]